MKNLKYFLLAICCAFIACNDDTDGPFSKNSNSNQNVLSAEEEVYTEKGYTAQAKNAIYNMEMPKLKGGNNAFVSHYIDKYGLNYAMEYDLSKRAARWTAYQCHNDNNVNNWNRNNWRNGQTFNGYGGGGDPFQPDPVIPKTYQTTLEEHASNGYDRGHMLGSADRVASKEANGQTFYLSNMHPQLSTFNQQGIWYNLESWVRSKNTSSFRDTLYIVKGGTIDDDANIKEVKKGLVVPKYFFMALLCKKSSDPTQGGYKAIAFWMEHKNNTDNNYIKYAISIDELEKKTGIDFFCNLPDDIEAAVESNLVTAAWGLK